LLLATQQAVAQNHTCNYIGKSAGVNHTGLAFCDKVDYFTTAPRSNDTVALAWYSQVVRVLERFNCEERYR
jgi:hypothetical protein